MELVRKPAGIYWVEAQTLIETITQLVVSVKKLEKTVCRCHDRLLSPSPHYAPREEEEMVEEEEEEEEEEDGLEYETEDTSKGSYTTPPSTGGHFKHSPAPSCSPTPEDSDPETNAVLHTEELEACIEAFLEEVEEDMEISDLPPLKNISLLLVPALVVLGFVPFAVSTGQRCVPPKSLLGKVYHPYKDPVGRCCCEPGGWCYKLPYSGQVQRVSHKIRGCGLSNGGSRSGRSCCSTDKEPCDQSGSSYDGRTPTCALCLGSLEL